MIFLPLLIFLFIYVYVYFRLLIVSFFETLNAEM